MRAYILFGRGNIHPYARWLHQDFKHVWCIIADENANAWIGYDWDLGLPKIKSIAPLDFDISGFYRADGWEVITLAGNYKPSIVRSLFILNNCVGNVKVALGIRGFAFTPYQLYKQMTRSPSRLWSWITVPGLGGKTSAAPLPAPPLPPVAPKSATTIAADKRLASDEERARTAAQKTAAATVEGDGVLIDDGDDDNKTLFKKGSAA